MKYYNVCIDKQVKLNKRKLKKSKKTHTKEEKARL